MKFKPTNVQPAQENFLDGLVYFFKSDSKIADQITGLKTKLSKIKDDDLKKIFIKIRTYKYSDLLKFINVMEDVYKATDKVVEYADAYNKALDTNVKIDDDNDSLEIESGETPEAKMAFINMINAMKKAGKSIGPRYKVEELKDTEPIDGSKTSLGDMGYTLSNVQNIVKRFTEDIRKNKALYDLLNNINSDLDMAAMSWGDEELTMYHNCVRCAYRGFKAVDYFLFSLDRRIK